MAKLIRNLNIEMTTNKYLEKIAISFPVINAIRTVTPIKGIANTVGKGGVKGSVFGKTLKPGNDLTKLAEINGVASTAKDIIKHYLKNPYGFKGNVVKRMYSHPKLQLEYSKDVLRQSLNEKMHYDALPYTKKYKVNHDFGIANDTQRVKNAKREFLISRGILTTGAIGASAAVGGIGYGVHKLLNKN